LLIEGEFSDELRVKKLYCLQPQHIFQLSIERKEVNIKFGKSAVTILVFYVFSDDHLAYCGSWQQEKFTAAFSSLGTPNWRLRSSCHPL